MSGRLPGEGESWRINMNQADVSGKWNIRWNGRERKRERERERMGVYARCKNARREHREETRKGGW
jgi:hypothetical protein